MRFSLNWRLGQLVDSLPWCGIWTLSRPQLGMEERQDTENVSRGWLMSYVEFIDKRPLKFLFVQFLVFVVMIYYAILVLG